MLNFTVYYNTYLNVSIDFCFFSEEYNLIKNKK